ncbi:MAG TPA: diaminobutyrate--2-oxoglutarate transaminase [Gaiellaceae bacterium]|nr:diaminobutyrate--2-oxoglutarate transaminase [Gaiellaceae bacterium]
MTTPAVEVFAVPAVFEERESEIRSYCRAFPAVWTSARGAHLYAADGRAYVDFLAGAGALNYGHNHPALKAALVEYLAGDGVGHALDMHTTAKEAFLSAFVEDVLEPRGLDHKVQFTGPTGTNAVEAAFKVARKATGRSGVFAFMGGYHGHTLGSLAATANRYHRGAAGVDLGNVTFLPFPGGPTRDLDTLGYLRTILADSHSGVDLPAAVIVETVQAEGGVNVAPAEWLAGLAEICAEHGILLIVDEIQTGCGRTGPFLSFERAGIVPDVVVVSKSISGLGLPMALTLIRPEFDVWSPGEHTGTFRGNQLAFVTGTAALALWRSGEVQRTIERNTALISDILARDVVSLDERLELRGIGMLWGVDTARIDPTGVLAAAIGERCFADGLVIERVGRNDTVLKLLPPLTIDAFTLGEGLAILAAATSSCLPT